MLNRSETIAQANPLAARLLASEHDRLSNKPFAQFIATTSGMAFKALLQANHAMRMIQQILDFSRRSVLEWQMLDLPPLLAD
jgi:hypothetical protein